MHFDIILLQRQHEELKTQKLLYSEIRGLQDELAAFIMDKVVNIQGCLNILAMGTASLEERKRIIDLEKFQL